MEDHLPPKPHPPENAESTKVNIMNKLQWLRRHIKKNLPIEKVNETMTLLIKDAQELKDFQVSKHLETLVKYMNEHWPIDPNLSEREQWNIKEVISDDIENIMRRILNI